MTIAEGKKTYHGVTKILTRYHIICDTYLGPGRFVRRIIPCDWPGFRNSTYLPWDTYLVPKDHPRYSSVPKCKYYPILGQHNDRVIMDLIDIGIHE